MGRRDVWLRHQTQGKATIAAGSAHSKVTDGCWTPLTNAWRSEVALNIKEPALSVIPEDNTRPGRAICAAAN
jgi:hypothetical protein